MHARLPKRLARASAAALATGALMAAGLSAPADAGNANGHGKGHCRAFHALGDGVTNADGTTTANIYRGSHEFGTTTGTFVLGTAVDDVTPFTGTIVFANDEGTGTLTADPVEGTLDMVSGKFRASSSAVTGTGDYANVTGKLRVWGTQDLTDGTFSEHLLAKLCVPKKKQH
jgi:hypothetical protein